MPRSVMANCNPRMLAWARDDAGYSLEAAAEKTRFSPERLSGWERGDEKPTISQLRKLADVYRRPLALFFMPDPPPGFQPMKDFRRMPEAEDLRWSPALRALIRRVRAQQRVLAELSSELDIDRAELPQAPERADAEALGNFIRQTLGLGLEEQQTWRDEATALRGWTRAVEARGVMTAYTSTTRGQTISLDEMLGFSDPDPVPAIVLNGRDYPRRRVFTLLHEFAHLLLRNAGVCDLHDRYTTPNFDPTEVFCNAAAAAALMPADAFLQDPAVRRGAGTEEWGDQELSEIARRFTTSREATLRRLLTLGLTTENYYREWRDQYRREFDVQAEEARGGFANYYQLKVRELGLPYISTVLDAYSQHLINVSDLARFLNIKLRSLPGVEEEVVKSFARAG